MLDQPSLLSQFYIIGIASRMESQNYLGLMQATIKGVYRDYRIHDERLVRIYSVTIFWLLENIWKYSGFTRYMAVFLS